MTVKYTRPFAKLMVVMMMLPLLLGFGTSVFAASTNSDGMVEFTVPSEDEEALSNVEEAFSDDTIASRLQLDPKSDSAFYGDGPVPIAEVSASVFSFNARMFEEATDKSRKRALKQLAKTLSNSKMSDQTQQNIYDVMSESSSDVSRMLVPIVIDSTSADMFTAMKWIQPLLPFVRIVFGVGAFIIAIALVGSTILDLVFIGLPFARERMSVKGEGGAGGGGGGGKVAMVTTDAYSVVQEVESSLGSNGGYKNAYMLYFKRRALSYVLLSLCLLWLVAGELGGLIGWVLQIGSGILPS